MKEVERCLLGHISVKRQLHPVVAEANWHKVIDTKPGETGNLGGRAKARSSLVFNTNTASLLRPAMSPYCSGLVTELLWTVTIMCSVSNHSHRGKSILILVAFLHALNQVLCIYYTYPSRENLLLIDNLLFCWGAFYNHSTLLPRHSQKAQKAEFPMLTIPKKKTKKPTYTHQKRLLPAHQE